MMQSFAVVLSAVTRDRDEILALLDVQERQKYERHRSRSSEEEYGTYTSAEVKNYFPGLLVHGWLEKY